MNVYSLTEGYLAYFCFWALTNKAATNTHKFCVNIKFLLLWNKCLGV